MPINIPYMIPNFVNIGSAKTTFYYKDINFIACLLYLFIDLGTIRYKRPARDAAEGL